MQTFKYYNSKKQRLGVFAESMSNNGKIRLIIIPCSKQDNFSKKLSILAYKTQVQSRTNPFIKPTFDYRQEIISQKETIQKDVINWCNENFYKLKQVHTKTIIEKDILFKNGSQIVLNKRIKYKGL
jgi:hypothetical protein